MAFLHPVTARLVRAEFAEEVISPPYDLLSRSQRCHIAETRERSYLNATRSPEDFGVASEEVIRVAKEYVAARLAEGAFGPQRRGLFVYRVADGTHTQTGVVGEVEVDRFPEVVRPHERTRVDRERQLANHLREVGVSSSPVSLGYRSIPEVDAVVAEVTGEVPVLDVEVDGERQQVWVVSDEAESRIVEALDVDAAYIIDGHHRVAAAQQLARDPAGDESVGRFLAVLIPDRELTVFPFHRWIGAPWPGPESPTGGRFPSPSPGVAIALTPDGWVLLDLSPLPDEMDSAALSRVVLGPRFGVADERTDERLVFVPGALGPGVLAKRVETRGGVGFLLHPVDFDALMRAADRGDVLPPKSTFFAPKPRSGIFLAERASK